MQVGAEAHTTFINLSKKNGANEIKAVSFKLFLLNVPVRGIQAVVETIAGKKMQALLAKNYA